MRWSVARLYVPHRRNYIAMGDPLSNTHGIPSTDKRQPFLYHSVTVDRKVQMMGGIDHVLPAATISAVRLFGMDGTAHDRWHTFARAISGRREALALTQREVYAAGGPSPTTLVRWETGEEPDNPPRAKSLARLDSALRWPGGTSKKLLDGDLIAEDAIQLPTSSGSYKSGGDEPDPTSLESALDPTRVITDLSGRILRYLMASTSIHGIEPALAEEGQELTELVSEYYITLLLERYGGPDRELPDTIGSVVIPALTAPEPPQGSPEHHRWSYRRWLAGVSFPSDSAQDFQQYWDAKHGRI